jgi:LCP family protein required for cell wall assembly
MTDTRSPDKLDQGDDVLGAKAAVPGSRRRRRGLRIMAMSLASATVLLGATAAGAFIYVNHELGSIPRIPVKFLAQEDRAKGMTVLLTGSEVGPTGMPGTSQVDTGSGLIMLLHINGNHEAGGVVSISPQLEVNVPGKGEMQLWQVEAAGGPSLLTEIVHNLTGVPIDHYIRIDFNHVDSMVDALRGVSVRLPRTEVSFGHVFRKGVDRVYGVEALEYARQPSLTETGRVLRQDSLMRAVVSKLADKHLFTDPLTVFRVLNALVSMLTVDSTFTNSQVVSLATGMGWLSSRASTYVSAPTETVDNSVVLIPGESRALWSAITSDSIAAFAKRYPGTVTPAAP